MKTSTTCLLLSTLGKAALGTMAVLAVVNGMTAVGVVLLVVLATTHASGL